MVGFHAQQAKIVTNSTTNKLAWAILDAALDALTDRQAEYEPLYVAAAILKRELQTACWTAMKGYG